MNVHVYKVNNTSNNNDYERKSDKNINYMYYTTRMKDLKVINGGGGGGEGAEYHSIIPTLYSHTDTLICNHISACYCTCPINTTICYYRNNNNSSYSMVVYMYIHVSRGDKYIQLNVNCCLYEI